MSPELQPLGRLLIVFGLILIGIGAVLMIGPKMPWLGRLPGDILIKREHSTFYFPLTTSILLSLLLSFIMWLLGKRH